MVVHFPLIGKVTFISARCDNRLVCNADRGYDVTILIKGSLDSDMIW